VSKLGSGGFAKVFLVKRLTDGARFALKFMEPKNDKERNLIRNEVNVM
jgi:serine/threonine protein kinase